MKKIIATLLVFAMLIANLIPAYAAETNFISINGDYKTILTEDGRLFSWDGKSSFLDLVDTEVVDFYDANYYIKKDLYANVQYGIQFYTEKEPANRPDLKFYFHAYDIIQDENGDFYYYNQLSDHNTNQKMVISKKETYVLTEDNSLYEMFDKSMRLVCNNVLDFYALDYNESRYYGNKIAYRDNNSNLYYDDELILENCSELYLPGKYNIVKTNDGKWYHWGYNYFKSLEPEKIIDGNDISPAEINKPMLATEFVLQFKLFDKMATWALDGNLYYDGKKVLDNIEKYTDGGSFFINSDGDVAVYNYDIKDYIVLDTNLVNADFKYHDCIYGINKDGNFVYALKEDNYKLHVINADYKYLNRSNWAEAEISAADQIGYIDSVKDFDMQSYITREDFCNMIVDFVETYQGKELSTTSNPFKDTENEKVIKAYANNIITGVSSNEFAPEEKITREQMCAIMTRAAKFLKPDVQFGQGIAFSDMDLVSDWAIEGVNAMSGLGIVKGDGVSITPKSNTSVEQAIAMTYRLYNIIR